MAILTFHPPPLTLGIQSGYHWRHIIELAAALYSCMSCYPALLSALNHRRNAHLPSLTPHKRVMTTAVRTATTCCLLSGRVKICSRFPFQSFRQGHTAKSHVPIRYHSVSVLLSIWRREGDNMESIFNLHKELYLYRLASTVPRKHNLFYFVFIRILNIYHCASLPISSHMLSSTRIIFLRWSDRANASL